MVCIMWFNSNLQSRIKLNYNVQNASALNSKVIHMYAIKWIHLFCCSRQCVTIVWSVNIVLKIPSDVFVDLRTFITFVSLKITNLAFLCVVSFYISQLIILNPPILHLQVCFLYLIDRCYKHLVSIFCDLHHNIVDNWCFPFDHYVFKHCFCQLKDQLFGQINLNSFWNYLVIDNGI